MTPSAFEDSRWPKDSEEPVTPLTREQALAVIAKNPSMSPWLLIAAQALVGVVVAVLWGLVSWRWTSFVSALYGAVVVVVPSALMARGVFGQDVRHGGVARLLVWEIAKLVLAGVLLASAPVWIRPLDWAAMLVTMVLCLKVIGVALLLQGRVKNK